MSGRFPAAAAAAVETVEPRKQSEETQLRERGGKNRCGFQLDYQSDE